MKTKVIKMSTLLAHDILLPDGKIFNTVAGISYIREAADNKKQDSIVSIETKVKSLPIVYEELDTCYVYLTFSFKCNLSCIYCFQHTEKFNSIVMNNEEIYSKYSAIIDKLKKIYSKIVIILYGGEPLLIENKDIIKKFLPYLEKEKIPLRIVTNGVLLNEFIDILCQYPYLQAITITIDGTKSIHDSRRKIPNNLGSYDKIVENLNLALKKLSSDITIRVNLDRQNLKIQDEFITSMIKIQSENNKKFGICYYRTTNKTESYNDDYVLDIISFSKIMDHIIYTYSDKILIKCGDNIYNQMKDILEKDYLVYPRLSYCEYGFIYVLGADGRIYLCGEATGDSQFELCSINDENIVDKIQQNKKIYNVFNTLSPCAVCEVNTICGGGCALSKRKKENYCEKKEIIEALKNMYLFRQNSV